MFHLLFIYSSFTIHIYSSFESRFAWRCQEPRLRPSRPKPRSFPSKDPQVRQRCQAGEVVLLRCRAVPGCASRAHSCNGKEKTGRTTRWSGNGSKSSWRCMALYFLEMCKLVLCSNLNISIKKSFPAWFLMRIAGFHSTYYSPPTTCQGFATASLWRQSWGSGCIGIKTYQTSERIVERILICLYNSVYIYIYHWLYIILIYVVFPFGDPFGLPLWHWRSVFFGALCFELSSSGAHDLLDSQHGHSSAVRPSMSKDGWRLDLLGVNGVALNGDSGRSKEDLVRFSARPTEDSRLGIGSILPFCDVV